MRPKMRFLGDFDLLVVRPIHFTFNVPDLPNIVWSLAKAMHNTKKDSEKVLGPQGWRGWAHASTVPTSVNNSSQCDTAA